MSGNGGAPALRAKLARRCIGACPINPAGMACKQSKKDVKKHLSGKNPERCRIKNERKTRSFFPVFFYEILGLKLLLYLAATIK